MKSSKNILTICAAIMFFALSVSSQQSTNTKALTMNKSDAENQTIFPKGDRAPAANFTGTVRVKMPAAKTANDNFSIGSVTFEPGARSNWHTHPAGQTLIVINGLGLYQDKRSAR